MAKTPAAHLLPHPFRIEAAQPGFFAQLKALFGAREWPIVRKHLGQDTLSLPEIGWQLSRHEPLLPHFNLMAQGIRFAPGNTEQGGFFGMLAWMRQSEFPAPVFRFTDELAHLLEHTDIAPDVPLSCLALPYPRFYLELGSARDLETVIPNILSGDHVLEGAYIESGWYHDMGQCIYITLTGSPQGREDATDDATLSLILDMADLDAPLDTVIKDAFEREHRVAEAHGFPTSPADYLPASLAAMQLIVKALLYLNLPEARREAKRPKSELEQKLGQLKSSAKRAKLERKVGPVYDFIEVSAPQGTGPSPDEGAGGGVKAHWRRGHYRMQAHGPQHSLRKLLFIRPVLVGHLGEARLPTYRVE